MIGMLRGGARHANIAVTLEDRFRGFRTLVSGVHQVLVKSTPNEEVWKPLLAWKSKIMERIDDLKIEYVAGY